MTSCLARGYILTWGGKTVISKEHSYLMIASLSRELYDYKLFCFNGKVRFFKIDFGRFSEHHANYYDRNQHIMPFGELDYPPVPEKSIEMPASFAWMIEKAELMSKNHPFMRIDFYESAGHPFFGEITFFPASGMGKLTPPSYDLEVGSWLKLPFIYTK